MDNTVNILGIEFSSLTLKDTMSLISSKINNNTAKTFHIITANPEIAVQIQEDNELKKIALEADLITPDGIGIVFASKLKRTPIPERVTGFDLLVEALKLGNLYGWSFYFLGSDEAVNSRMAEYVSENYPKVKVTGRHNGYFNAEEEVRIIDEIEELRPDILIIALGSPITDKLTYKYKNRITAKVTFGVGGSMDVLTGKVKQTPEIWKKLNLEWLHRRIITPSRRERQKKLKVFVYRAFKEALGLTKH